MQRRDKRRWHERGLYLMSLAWGVAYIYSQSGAVGQAKPTTQPVTQPVVQTSQREDGQWPMAAKNYANTRYSGLDQINTENVGQLQVAWTFSTGVTRGHE